MGRPLAIAFRLPALVALAASAGARAPEQGLLVCAGAIEGTGELRGVRVMRGDRAAVARAVAADPAVRAGRFRPRILRWWTAWGTIPGH